jgi:hypothetical protein
MLSDKELLQSMDAQRSRRRDCRNHNKKVSVRELEKIADELRSIGDEHGADYFESQALTLLDIKICRKIVRQSRRTKHGLSDLVEPLMKTERSFSIRRS